VKSLNSIDIFSKGDFHLKAKHMMWYTSIKCWQPWTSCRLCY